MVGMGAGGVDFDMLVQAFLAHQVAEHPVSGGRATNVAHADEQNLDHILHPAEMIVL